MKVLGLKILPFGVPQGTPLGEFLHRRNSDWWCCNCQLRVALTRHGRCEKCGTLAVQYDLRWPALTHSAVPGGAGSAQGESLRSPDSGHTPPHDMPKGMSLGERSHGSRS